MPNQHKQPLNYEELQADSYKILMHCAEHMLTQKKKAWDDVAEACVFQDSNGCMCAAGCFMPESLLQKDLVGFSGINLYFKGEEATLEEQQFWTFLNQRRDLLGSLMAIHDEYEVHEWEKELTNIALRLLTKKAYNHFCLTLKEKGLITDA